MNIQNNWRNIRILAISACIPDDEQVLSWLLSSF